MAARSIDRYYPSGEQVQIEDVVLYGDEFAIVKAAFGLHRILIRILRCQDEVKEGKVKFPTTSSISLFYRPKAEEDPKIYLQTLLSAEIDTSPPLLPVAISLGERIRSIDDEYDLLNFRASIVRSGLRVEDMIFYFQTNRSVLSDSKHKILDLSQNDIDPSFLAGIVRLSEIIQPTVIDLSFCRIAADHQNTEYITKLLGQSSVRYLICIGNACATSDNMELFQTPDILSKFIWISNCWLERPKYWDSIVPSGKIQGIKDLHQDCFRLLGKIGYRDC